MRWEQRLEVPLLLLAFAFLVAYAWPILDRTMNRTIESTLTVASWAVWAAFLADFLVRVGLAKDRRRYVLKHWYDVALIALPMLRPLRLLRLLAFARLLNRSVVPNLAGRVGVYVTGAAVSAVGIGALAVLDAERDAQGSNITSAGDALWWATTTVTTVGYGDHYPVTTSGRLVAAALMVVGIAVVGAVTGAVAAWLVEQVGAGAQTPERHEGNS